MKLWLVLLALLSSAFAQPFDPARFVRDYLAAYNAGEAEMRAFFEKHAAATPPVASRLERYREMRSNLGALTLKRMANQDSQAARAIITTRNEGDFLFEFMLNGDQPPRMAGIRVQGPMDEPSAAPPAGPRLDESAALREIAQLVKDAAAKDEFSGAVMLQRGDNTIFQTATGMADINAGVPNRITTLFNIGSIVKDFTKAAIAQLQAGGKLNLTDTVGKILPDYPNKDAAANVTIQHLLTMRSGIGDFFGPRYESTPKDHIRSLSDYLALFGDQPLAFRPGASQQYSNGGFIVLGLIIEKLSGMSYYDYVRKTVFDRADMTETGFFDQDLPKPGMATGYTRRAGSTPDGKRRSNLYTLPARGSSAGGAYSTVADLLRFGRAVEAGRFLRPNAPRELNLPGGMGIAGGAPGLNAVLETGLPGGYRLAVCANYDPPAAEALARRIRGVLERVVR